jgi:hypothetical protein
MNLLRDCPDLSGQEKIILWKAKKAGFCDLNSIKSFDVG